MMPNVVGAGVWDPRPALRQPLAQLRQSSVGDRLKATISPMAGTPRVSRCRLPTTSTKATPTHTVAEARSAPELSTPATPRPRPASPVKRSSPLPIWPRRNWLMRALPRLIAWRTSRSGTRRNPLTCWRATRSSGRRRRFHVQAWITSPARRVRPAMSE